MCFEKTVTVLGKFHCKSYLIIVRTTYIFFNCLETKISLFLCMKGKKWLKWAMERQSKNLVDVFIVKTGIAVFCVYPEHLYFLWLIKVRKIFFQILSNILLKKIHKHICIHISNFVYMVFFLSWNSFRECQISNSSVARITTFLPPSCHDGRQIRNLSSRNFSGILCKPKYHLWSKFFLSIQSIKKIC